MPESPDQNELEACGGEPYKYDFAQAERILMEMDLQRGEAVKRNIGEIVTMIDAAFRLLLTTYHCILRYDVTRMSGDDGGSGGEPF